ncbi:expressed unknown protein [Seminavis robusta]|uniref:BZIP domain-containing protein n=1 Tax=Seminavis robusta TaxID=568900 RepID=A0A9N8H5E5_9STRA|nr:expressed unknown protein [Seminavis robusta]|eukprot:Sro141_g065740.1 n/a (723) ;mRNA; f:23751-25919
MSSSSSEGEDQEDRKPSKKRASASDQAYAEYLASTAAQPTMGAPPPVAGVAHAPKAASLPGAENASSNDDDGSTDQKPKAKKRKTSAAAASKKAGKKRPAPAAAAAGSYASKTASRGRGSFYVGRRKGFIDDSEIPENETPTEKKRRLNRNNERRKRARRVFKIDFLTEKKDVLSEKNEKIKKDNQALRDHIARIRENLQAGNLSNLRNLTEGPAPFLPAAEVAALAANSPYPSTAVMGSPPNDDEPSAAGSEPSPSPVRHLVHPIAAVAAATTRPDAASLGAVLPQARHPPQAAVRQGSPLSEQQVAVSHHHQSPPQDQQLLPMPRQAFAGLSSSSSSAATGNALQNSELMDSLRRQALLLRGGIGNASILGGTGYSNPLSALGLGGGGGQLSENRRTALLATLRQDAALQRMGGGLAGTNAEIARLRLELLQAQQATSIPTLSSLANNNNTSRLAAAGLGGGLGGGSGGGGQLSRESSDPSSPAALRQRLLDLASRNPAGPLQADDLLAQLRSQQQPNTALQLSDLLLSASAGQASLANSQASLAGQASLTGQNPIIGLGQLQQQQQHQQQQQANPFLLAALQRQSLQQLSTAPTASQGPRSLPATNVGALPSQNLPPNRLQTELNNPLANPSATLQAASNLAGFGRPSSLAGGASWRGRSAPTAQPSTGRVREEASLMALLAATEQRRGDIDPSEGDVKDDDTAQHPSSPGQHSACHQS